MKSMINLVKKFLALINSVAALHVGLAYLGYNVLNVAMIPGTFVPYIHYIVGLSGALYLAAFALCLVTGCSSGSCTQGSSCGCGMMGK